MAAVGFDIYLDDADPHTTRSEDGEPLSEWTVSVGDLEAFLARTST